MAAAQRSNPGGVFCASSGRYPFWVWIHISRNATLNNDKVLWRDTAWYKGMDYELAAWFLAGLQCLTERASAGRPVRRSAVISPGIQRSAFHYAHRAALDEGKLGRTNYNLNETIIGHFALVIRWETDGWVIALQVWHGSVGSRSLTSPVPFTGPLWMGARVQRQFVVNFFHRSTSVDTGILNQLNQDKWPQPRV